MKVYGSRKCAECQQKYDWVGSLYNQINAETYHHVLRHRYLQFAKFTYIGMNTYKALTHCPYCSKENRFTYTSLSAAGAKEDSENSLQLAIK
ncbi:hypothetical protein JQN58_12900 [Aneurinibacillus sp. BA2021]|nr:hypothetical protein [Aneurinibacillus sp. BA2021]